MIKALSYRDALAQWAKASDHKSGFKTDPHILILSLSPSRFLSLCIVLSE